MRVNIPDPIEEAVWRALRGVPHPWRGAVADQILRRGKPSRRKRFDLDDGGVPVEPNKPRDLSGGAAAALEFDD